MEDAECRRRPDLSPDDFILDRGQSSKPAKSACNACPVSKECVDYAHRTGSLGIWGGEVQKFAAPRTIQDARPQKVVPYKDEVA